VKNEPPKVKNEPPKVKNEPPVYQMEKKDDFKPPCKDDSPSLKEKDVSQKLVRKKSYMQ